MAARRTLVFEKSSVLDGKSDAGKILINYPAGAQVSGVPPPSFPFLPREDRQKFPRPEEVFRDNNGVILSMVGVLAWAMAFPSKEGFSPQPSRIIRKTGLTINMEYSIARG